MSLEKLIAVVKELKTLQDVSEMVNFRAHGVYGDILEEKVARKVLEELRPQIERLQSEAFRLMVKIAQE